MAGKYLINIHCKNAAGAGESTAIKRRNGPYRLLWVLCTVILFFLMGAAKGYPRMYFSMQDQAGDEYGPGTYKYPLNRAFEPYRGLFDLVSFRVWAEDDQNIYYDLKFQEITNPWSAPEGFIHPVIQVYIDKRPGGLTIPVNKGNKITFSPRYPWDIAIFGIGWGGSKLYVNTKKDINRYKISARLQGDGKTVRLEVPRKLTGEPRGSWKYYVLVSSYDGFAPGSVRTVKKDRGNWVFGGGRDDEWDPNIIDILAPRGLQEKMLSGFNPKENRPACLTPVGVYLKNSWKARMMWLVLTVFVITLAVIWRYLKGKNMLPTFLHWYIFRKNRGKSQS